MTFLSLVESVLEAVHVRPQALQIAHIDTLVGRYYPNLSVDRPAVIGPLTGPTQCEALCRLLALAYPAAHIVQVVDNVGRAAPAVQPVALPQLAGVDLSRPDVLLYVPPLSQTGAVETFQDTVAHLRAPNGCPWDRKQTHRSLRRAFLEEVYEVLDALDRNDLDNLQEELGDTLLLVLMQAQIGSESGAFQLSDIVRQVNAKIVRRHPHVFAGLAVSGVDEVLLNWEAIKRGEKGEREEKPSVLDSVSRSMPSLARAQSIQRHVDWMEGIDWEADVLLRRVAQSIQALHSALDAADRRERIGDLLFDLANLARRWEIDVEGALREANNRFEARFRAWEKAPDPAAVS